MDKKSRILKEKAMKKCVALISFLREFGIRIA